MLIYKTTVQRLVNGSITRQQHMSENGDITQHYIATQVGYIAGVTDEFKSEWHFYYSAINVGLQYSISW